MDHPEPSGQPEQSEQSEQAEQSAPGRWAAIRVRIYISDGASWRGQPLYLSLLDLLHQQGAAGATAFRGIAGFGGHSRVHTSTVEVLAGDLPVVVEWIDAPDRVDRLMPAIAGMVPEGMITVEQIESISRPGTAEKATSPYLIPTDRTVGEVMTTDVVTAPPDTPVRKLVELLLGHIYRALPVVDSGGKLIGIVTSGDLVDRAGLRLRAELLSSLDRSPLDVELRRLEQSGKTAADIMTTDVAAVRSEVDLASAARLMVVRRLKRLPVVDADHRLVGIVARSDILRAIAPPSPHPQSSDADSRIEDQPAAAQPPESGLVGAVMTRRVPSVPGDAGIADVLSAVISTRLNRAIVVDDQQRPIGVISDDDLMRRLERVEQPGLAEALMRRLPFRRPSPEERLSQRGEQASRAVDLMVTPLPTIEVATPIAEAARLMLDRRHKILPVVDDDCRLIGMVDRADLLRGLAIGSESSGQAG